MLLPLLPPRFRGASASYVSPSASGTPWAGGGSRGAPSPVSFGGQQHQSSGRSGGASAHRQPVPTLTFPQFLEALRLLAEDIIGHPQVRALPN